MQEAFEAFDELSCDSNVFEFHGESFSRPTTIPADLFCDSINAMDAGIQRNGYVHWTRADGGKRPECNHEVCRGHTLSSCADCRKLLMHPKQIIVEKEWQKKIRSMDAKNKDHMSMLHSCGVTEWLLAFTLSLDDLVIASFVTGPGANTLPILIFSRIRLGLRPDINALATIIILFVAILVAIAAVILFRQQKRDLLDQEMANSEE